ncbi:unnamed protein product [Aphanomyces euteiches]|nr:hypothetical protein Ae201684P_000101 [Aphanomyces euteiches]KAH9158083.1 hypothetical protein AeRB84_000119 [Aphanomyces euteiches]
MQVARVALLFLSAKCAAASLREPASLTIAEEETRPAQAARSSAPWPVADAEPARFLKMAAINPELLARLPKAAPSKTSRTSSLARKGLRPSLGPTRVKALRTMSRSPGNGALGPKGEPKRKSGWAKGFSGRHGKRPASKLSAISRRVAKPLGKRPKRGVL